MLDEFDDVWQVATQEEKLQRAADEGKLIIVDPISEYQNFLGHSSWLPEFEKKYTVYKTTP